MIHDVSLLTDKEVLGVLQTLDDTEHPIRWMFRDDSTGIKFVYYAKWLEDLETEYSSLIMKIFERFCNKHNIVVEQVYMARITMLVHTKEEVTYKPEVGYPNPENVFVYFVSNSDRKFFMSDMSIIPRKGHAVSFKGSDGYSFQPPHHDNFFIMIEVEYR